MMRTSYKPWYLGASMAIVLPWAFARAADPASVNDALPPVALPPTTTTAPATASSAGASPVTESAAVNVKTANPEDVKFSYGPFLYSLLFTPEQIDSMKSALKTYESIQSPKNSGEVAVTISAAPQAPTIPEPSVYPVFFLSSIAYRSANDWTVWVKQNPSPVGGTTAGAISPTIGMPTAVMSGSPTPSPTPAARTSSASSDPSIIRITPKQNKGELRIVHVSATGAEFAWYPTYTQAVTQRYARKIFAPIDTVKHRLATKCSPILFDNASQTVHFALRQGQSFSAAYSNCFEGNIEPPTLAPLNGSNAIAASTISPTSMTPAAAQDINSLLGQQTTPSPATATAVAPATATMPNSAPAPALPVPVTPAPTPAAPTGTTPH